MDLAPETAARLPRVFPASPQRLDRLRAGVALAEAARLGGLSLSRASIVERDPAQARPGEFDKLRAGVARAAAERARTNGAR